MHQPKPELDLDVNTDCHLQKTVIGTLECEVTGKAVTRDICSNCAIGKIHRKHKCTDVSGQIRVVEADQGYIYLVEKIFCAFIKDNIPFDFCCKCPKSHTTEVHRLGP